MPQPAPMPAHALPAPGEGGGGGAAAAGAAVQLAAQRSLRSFTTGGTRRGGLGGWDGCLCYGCRLRLRAAWLPGGRFTVACGSKGLDMPWLLRGDEHAGGQLQPGSVNNSMPPCRSHVGEGQRGRHAEQPEAGEPPRRHRQVMQSCWCSVCRPSRAAPAGKMHVQGGFECGQPQERLAVPSGFSWACPRRPVAAAKLLRSPPTSPAPGVPAPARPLPAAAPCLRRLASPHLPSLLHIN